MPKFLKVFFDVVLQYAQPQPYIEEMVPLLLERFSSGLCPVAFFLDTMHTLLLEVMQAVFRQFPNFVINL